MILIAKICTMIIAVAFIAVFLMASVLHEPAAAPGAIILGALTMAASFAVKAMEKRK